MKKSANFSQNLIKTLGYIFLQTSFASVIKEKIIRQCATHAI